MPSDSPAAVPDLSIVIPSFNEERRLPTTLHALRAFLDADGRATEVLVVDDGSTDGTSAVVREAERGDRRIRLIRLAQNQGKGAAVRTGIVNARGRRILFCDADGATPFEELYRLEAALERGARVAIGSRALPSSDTRVEARLYRRFSGRLFQAIVALLTVRDIADTQCGFKLFDAEVAHDLFSRMRMPGYSFDVEVLLMAARRGYAVAEVPVNWTHIPGSKVRVVRDGLKMALDVTLIRSNAMCGLYDAPHIAPARLPAPAAEARAP